MKELTEILGQSQPRISRHLKVLAEAGLVVAQPGGLVGLLPPRRPGAGRDVALGIVKRRSMPTTRKLAARQRAARRPASGRTARRRSAISPSTPSHWDEIRSLHVPERQVEAAMLRAPGRDRSAPCSTSAPAPAACWSFSPAATSARSASISRRRCLRSRAPISSAPAIDHARVRLGDVMNLPVVRDSFDLVVIHQVLHFLDDPAPRIAEAAAALSRRRPAARRRFRAARAGASCAQSQAHRRLGFSHAQMKQWIAAAGLKLEAAEDLASDGRSPAG